MARPTKLTEELETAICAAIEQGNYPEVAAQAQGLDRTTHYDWMLRGDAEPDSIYARYSHAVKTAGSKAQITLMGRISTGAVGWQGAAWILERTRPNLYGLDRTTKAIDRKLKSAQVDALKKNRQTPVIVMPGTA